LKIYVDKLLIFFYLRQIFKVCIKVDKFTGLVAVLMPDET